MKRFLASVVMTAAMVPSARADIAPSPVPAMGNLTLMKGSAKDVRMASEDVNITLHPSFAVVDATFVMANDGAETTMDVGFPGQGVMMGKGYSAHTAIHGLRAWVNGTEVKAAAQEIDHVTEGGPPGRGYKRHRVETWHTFKVTFARKGNTTVRVKYGVTAKVHYGDGGYGDTPPPLDEVWYILHTGAAWKGNIGKAVVHVTAAPGVDAASINMVNHGPVPGLSSDEKWERYRLPTGGKRTANGLELEWNAFTPQEADNIQLVFRCDPEKRRTQAWGAEEEALVKVLLEALK